MDTPRNVNQDYLLSQQYRDICNLAARINLHERFSTNKYGWHLWAFDQLKLPEKCHILELGCGPAAFWAKNLARIPPGWEITLSDLSPGMIAAAGQALADAGGHFDFLTCDAQALPFPERAFDCVIANHMLYHVPDLDKALAEVSRVLKPGGRFYASTIGQNHLREMDDLVTAFDPTIIMEHAAEFFSLENGAAKLLPWFKKVELYRYENELVITEGEPLAAYIISSVRIGPALTGNKLRLLKDFIATRLASAGPIHITNDTGLFEAVLE